MRLNKLHILALYCVLAAGCRGENKPDPEFLASGVIGLNINHTAKLVYDEATFQLGFNRDLKQFRVSDDNMSRYYVLTCSALPEHEGQEIKGSVRYVGYGDSYIRSGMEFKVEKIERDIIYLWCGSKKVGVSVKMLQ